MSRGGWLGLLALALVATEARADGAPELAEFVVARTRVEKRVTASGLLRNPTEGDLAGIRIVLRAYDGKRLVKTSGAFRRSVLPKGRACRVTLSIPMCPQFESYKIILQATAGPEDREWTWTAPSLSDPPALEIEAPRGAEVLLVSQSVKPGAGGTASVLAKVRNGGDAVAVRTAVRARFLNSDGHVMRERTMIVGDGSLRPGQEAECNFTVSRVSGFSDARLAVVHPRGAPVPVAPGEFTEAKSVEVAEFHFEKAPDEQLVVTGQVRNGLEHALKRVAISMILRDEGRKETRPDDVVVSGPIWPGEVRSFVAVLDGVSGFAGYNYEIAFDEDRKAGDRPPEDVEPPEVGETSEGPEPAGPPQRRFGVAGVHEVEGEFVGKGKSMTYSGDIILLKLKFYDEKGRSAKLTGTLQVLFSRGGTARGKAERPVTDAVYKFDWNKLQPKQVGEQTVAFDAGTNTVYAAVLRHTEDEKLDWQMEVRFTSKENERWTLWRLEDPWEAEPQEPDPPDKKKK